MAKLTSRNWVKASVNKKTKTIRFTKQFYKTQSEGLQMLSGKALNFMILNKKAIDKMIADGFTVVEQQQQKVTEQPVVDLTGKPEVEEAIRQYYIKKLQKRGVHFTTKPHYETEGGWNQSTNDHTKFQKELEQKQKTSMRESFLKAYGKYCVRNK